ncbi:MAG: alpha/beta hydrolase [Spirochaetota bacterium]|nr:alpha/beta hydrolase [Spirochaetota bacterium]
MVEADFSDKATPNSRFYYSQRLCLHFVDWGNEHKPLLLLIHGGKDHARSWDMVAKSLHNEYHIIAPDLRGHGDSSWAPGSMYSLLDSVLDIARLIEHLGASDTSIIGHSYGGAVAILYAGFYPEHVKRLAVIEGLGPMTRRFAKSEDDPLWKRVKRWIEATRRMENRTQYRFSSIQEAAERIRTVITSLSAEQAEHIANHGLKQNDDNTFSWKYDDCSRILSPLQFNAHEIREIERRIDCPTLFLYGANGWAGNPLSDNQAHSFRYAQSICIPEAGHWLHHDRLSLFLNTVRDFLND